MTVRVRVDINLPHLVETYGYAATFLGALFEGETMLTLGGLAAHRGRLLLPTVWLVAAAGGTLGDIVSFALGRRYGEAALSRWPSFAPAIARAHRMIDKRPALAVIGVRFVYGMRIAGPFVIGSGGMSWLRFLPLNACGSLLWSACWIGIGYLLGAAAERWLANFAHLERELFVIVIVVALVVIVIARLRGRRRAASG